MATAPAPHYAGVPSDRKAVRTTLPRAYLERPADDTLATGLGLFSVGLGLAELLAPGDLADRTGTRRSGLVRAYGVRELVCGIGILASRRPAGWLWARVAGDLLDLATLGHAYLRATSAADRRKALESAAAVAGVTALDVFAAREHGGSPAA